MFFDFRLILHDTIRKKGVCDMRKAVLLLMCVFFLTAFASCKRTKEQKSHEDTSDSSNTPATEAPADLLEEEETVVFDQSLEYGLNEFDKSLIDYLCQNGYYDSDIVLSPAGCRAMLCLAATGAEGNTQTELVSAAGFSGTDEMKQWYDHYRNATALYLKDGDTNGATTPIYAVQSIWNDTAQMGNFTPAFQTTLGEQYHAEAYSSNAQSLTEEIDSWLNKTTDGTMTTFNKNVSGAADVLLSAVYLETLWQEEFYKSDSIGGKPMMKQTGRFLYADKSGTQIVVLPMKGNLSFVCFKGNRTDMFDKLTVLRSETVNVVLPELEMETVFDANDLLNFCISRSVQEALNGRTANFRPMCVEKEWFLQEMLQSSKLSVGNSGTAEAPASSTEAEAKDFIADGSWSFAVISEFGTQWQQILLYGQRTAGAE